MVRLGLKMHYSFFFPFCKKIIKYYQPRQLVMGLLWEMSVRMISPWKFSEVVILFIYFLKIWLKSLKFWMVYNSRYIWQIGNEKNINFSLLGILSLAVCYICGAHQIDWSLCFKGKTVLGFVIGIIVSLVPVVYHNYFSLPMI
jgi:hypothetical protein